MKKYLISLFILLISIAQVFAEWNADWSGLTPFFQNILQVVSILQAVWMIPASVAWALMSNDIVTWNAFGMTQALNSLWRISHNLAFLILGFLFVVGVFQVFFKKDQPLTSVRKLVWQIAISSILISASWFIIMVLLDISSILTFTASSFFASVWWASPATIPNYCQKTQNWDSTCWVLTATGAADLNTKFNNVWLSFTLDPENAKLENFFPRADFMAWPLIYLGKWVLQVDQYNFSPPASWWKDLAVATLTQLLIFLMFIVPVLLLLVTNFIRVFWIWMWLALAPFIVLVNVFWWKKINVKWFELNNIISLIFQPVIIVTALSFSLLFLYSMNSILIGANAQVSQSQLAENMWYTIFTDNAYWWSNYTVIVPKNESIWPQWIKNWIWYMIVSLFWVALVWSLLKAATATSQITKTLSDWATGFVEWFAKTLPLVPIPWGGAAGITALQKWLSGQTIGANTFQERNIEMQRRLENMVWIWNVVNDLSPSEQENINNKFSWLWLVDRIEAVTSWFSFVREELKDKKWVTLNTSNRLRTISENLLSKLEKDDWAKLWVTNWEDLKTLAKVQANPLARSFLAIMLWATSETEWLVIKGNDAPSMQNKIINNQAKWSSIMTTDLWKK